MERQEWMAVLTETVRELVSRELEVLLFLEREAFIEETGGRKNGAYPHLLETCTAR